MALSLPTVGGPSSRAAEPLSTATEIARQIEQDTGILRSMISSVQLQDHMPALQPVFANPTEDVAQTALTLASAARPLDAEREPLWAVIVETRKHPALAPVVCNVVEHCAAPVQLFHSHANLDYILAGEIALLIKQGKVYLTELNLPEQITQSRYNQLLLSTRFWSSVAGRNKVLIFQCDSMCCPAADFKADDFMRFDYIGSRWERARPVGLVIDGGSGGFSLRDWTLTRTCLERFPAHTWPGGEDGYFAFHMELLGGTVASMAQAGQFSTQDVFAAKSFGCHQISRLSAQQLAAFLDYCPSARRFFSLPETTAQAESARSRATATAQAKTPLTQLSSNRRVSMFISHQHRLIFFEVPRTGSHSVSNALNELDPESPTVAERERYGSGTDYHYLTDEALAKTDYRLIAAHRNPFDRLWSFWKHRKQNGNPDVFRTLSWNDYIDWVCNPNSTVKVVNALRDVPISEMLDTNRVTLWLDFHRINASWQSALQQLNIPFLPLRTLNVSPNHGPMQAAFNSQSSALVVERFAQDFETFGYSPDSWKPGEALQANQAVQGFQG
ncbi:MAG: DUF5672 family protein [Congregibacter sp.]